MSGSQVLIERQAASATCKFPWKAVAVVSLAATALLLTVVTRYGYFRDELYYLACGRHPAWGYVDQPPLIGWLAWLLRHTIGESLLAIRLLPALSVGAACAFTALVARELGGRRHSIITAAGFMAIMPIALSIGHLFTMNAFDYPLWLALVWLLLRMENTGDVRLWIAFGAVAGLTTLNKYGVLFFIAALALGTVATGWRRWFETWHFWVGAFLGALIALPNLLWQRAHGYPFLELMANIHRSGRDISPPPIPFFGQQLQIVNPVSMAVVLAGLVWLLAQRRFRALGIVFIAFYVVLEKLGAKHYYLGPVYPMMFAAGSVALEQWTERRFRWVLQTVLGLAFLVTVIMLPIAIPVLSADHFIAYEKITGIEPAKFERQRQGPLPQIYADMFGWPEMVEKVAAFYNTLPPEEKQNTAIFADNYGVGGALYLFGPRYGLPNPIGGHQSFYIWGPGAYRRPNIINVGSHDDETLQRECDSVQVVGRTDHPLARPSEHFDIYYCKGLRFDIQENWSKAKKFD